MSVPEQDGSMGTAEVAGTAPPTPSTGVHGETEARGEDAVAPLTSLTSLLDGSFEGGSFEGGAACAADGTCD